MNNIKKSSKETFINLNSYMSGGSKNCGKGQILRNGYTTSTGKRVPSSCIVAQSNSGNKTSIELERYKRSKENMHRAASKKFSNDKSVPKSCPKGQILKDGYKIASHKSHSKTGKIIDVKSTWVKPTCIKSQTSKSQKGPKLIVIMEKDVLAKYGYDKVKSLSLRERRRALHNAINDIKPLSVYRRLIALATLNKNKDVKLFGILRDDAEWIKSQTEYVAERISSSKRSSKNSKRSSKGGSRNNSYILSKNGSKTSGSKNKLFYYK